MCKYCGMHYCPPACPSYIGERVGVGVPVGQCSLCEGVICAEERVLERGGRLLCMACAENCDGEDLLYLMGAESYGELLREHLGWEARWVGERE